MADHFAIDSDRIGIGCHSGGVSLVDSTVAPVRVVNCDGS